MPKSKEQYSKREAAQRFEAALKGARLVKSAPANKPKPKKARR
jgi:hypothetical protein